MFSELHGFTSDNIFFKIPTFRGFVLIISSLENNDAPPHAIQCILAHVPTQGEGRDPLNAAQDGV